MRSQLFAESIFGQILEQSRPFLKYPAAEYAAALVQRKVVTDWQASELLAGRFCFYAGTFRLLGPLSFLPHSQLFVAEQPGAQRLVFLETIPRSPNQDTAGGGTTDAISGTPKAQPPLRHPHVARCVQVQTTATHELVAYEFHEAAWLGEVISQQAAQRPHRAHLITQLAATLSEFSHEALETFDPQRAVIDHNGHLRWLAGPRALVNDWAGDGSKVLSPEDRQLRAIRKFASWLGLPAEISHCSRVSEIISTLRPIAEPWTGAFPQGVIPGTRAVLNRMLRKGPSLQQIEAFHAERQYVSSPEQLTPRTASQSHNSTQGSFTRPLQLRPRRKKSTSGGSATGRSTDRPALSSDESNARTQLSVQHFDREWGRTQIRTPIGSRKLRLTAVIAAVVTGMATMQWIWRWSVPEARAQTEVRTDSSPPSDKSR